MPTLADYAPVRDRRFPDGLPAADRRRVSLVTVCRNARATIERTIASVHAQRGPDFEHVVVDGDSTDGTAELVRARLRPGDWLLSEPDRGISDALNKGVALAAGDCVQFVHADDWLADGQLAAALGALDATGADFVFGDLLFHEGGAASFLYQGDAGYAATIHRRMPNLNHPTVLARRACFERVGLFDLRYRCAMDYDWFLRLHLAGGAGAYVPGLRGNMNHDGVSNLRWRLTMREVAEIASAHGRSPALARAEMRYQIAKIALGRALKHRAAPAYRLARGLLNRSYRPVAGAGTGEQGGGDREGNDPGGGAAGGRPGPTVAAAAPEAGREVGGHEPQTRST
jgi:glycosyltransferase